MNLFNRPNQLTSWSNIQMKADKTAELNISGYIGMPEWWQFEPSMEKDLISTKEKMQAELKEISNLKAETIKVNIDSLGGDVNHGQAIYSALAKNPANIEVEYTGWSASIATIIAAAATDGNITMSPTNMILIHEGRGCECGVANSMRAYADSLDKVNGIMAGVYSSQTGKTDVEMMSIMSKNNGEGEWLTASEAKEIGLIKHIIEPMKAAASYDTSRLAKFGYKVPQNKLNSIQMKFGKTKNDDPVINTVAMEDGSILLYEGELKEGVKLQKSGEGPDFKLEGAHVNAKGDTITIDAENKVISVEVKAVESAGDESIIAQVAQILADFKDEITTQIDDLRSKGSSAIIPKVDAVVTPKVTANTQVSARKGVKEMLDEIAAEKIKERQSN